jgi:hypothetical protein
MGFSHNLELMAVIVVQDMIDLASVAATEAVIVGSRVYQHLAAHPDFQLLCQQYCNQKQVCKASSDIDHRFAETILAMSGCRGIYKTSVTKPFNNCSMTLGFLDFLTRQMQLFHKL